MKSKKKVFLTVLCAAALVVASVLGTMAFLTSKTATVDNTFTVGNVAITLDEAKTNDNGNGKPVEGAARVTENTYKLIPGHEYTKDPTIHVAAGSENSYVFVKVVNGLADAEAATDDNYKNVAAQMKANGWQQLTVKGTTVANVYYKESPVAAGNDITVFEKFKAKNDLTNEQLQTLGTKHITVIGYAIQADGFNTAAAAWEAAPTDWN